MGHTKRATRKLSSSRWSSHFGRERKRKKNGEQRNQKLILGDDIVDILITLHSLPLSHFDALTLSLSLSLLSFIYLSLSLSPSFRGRSHGWRQSVSAVRPTRRRRMCTALESLCGSLSQGGSLGPMCHSGQSPIKWEWPESGSRYCDDRWWMWSFEFSKLPVVLRFF